MENITLHEAGKLAVENWQATAVIVTIGMAFSRGVARRIKERAGWECEEADNTCIGGLEASHINHNRKYKDYNHPDNGKALCSGHHLDDHINRAGQNGLTKKQNKWAINSLRARVNKALEDRGAVQDGFDF